MSDGVVSGLAPHLTADRRRVEEHVRTLQRHGARRLGEPLVPADPDTQPTVPGGPGPESRVPRVEVELLFVTGTVRNVRLAVDPEHVTVCDDGHRIEVGGTRRLEERDRHDGTRAGGDLRYGRNRRIVIGGRGPREVLLLLALRKIAALEQLRGQDDVGALGDGLGHGRDRGIAILIAVGAECPLDDCHHYFPGHRLPVIVSRAQCLPE